MALKISERARGASSLLSYLLSLHPLSGPWNHLPSHLIPALLPSKDQGQQNMELLKHKIYPLIPYRLQTSNFPDSSQAGWNYGFWNWVWNLRETTAFMHQAEGYTKVRSFWGPGERPRPQPLKASTPDQITFDASVFPTCAIRESIVLIFKLRKYSWITCDVKNE